METNQAQPNDGPDNQDIGIGELAKRLYRDSVRRGEWDYVDPKYPEKGPMICPMMVDNRVKILSCIENLVFVTTDPYPQNHSTTIRLVIGDLLTFCQAHNIRLEYDHIQ